MSEETNSLKFDYQPHEKQKEIHISCSLESPNLWTIVASGRQAGKSKCAKYQSIHWAIKNPKTVTWYVCPSENQAKKVFREILLELSEKGLVKSKIQSKGDMNIELINRSMIEFKSSGAEDSLRGSSVHFCILDEASFMKKETIEDIILPTLGVTGKKILMISTPKGKNFFYESWMNAHNSNAKIREQFKSFKFTSLDNPHANKALIETFRSTLPEAIFKQEFEAEWTDSSNVFSNVNELACLDSIDRPVQGERYYMGVDIALAANGDFTVITIVNNKGQMLFVDRFRGLEAPEVRARIIDSINRFKPIEILIEENNQGLPLIQDLKRICPQIKGFITNSSNKPEIINELIASCSLREIRMLNNEDLKIEMNAFIFKLNTHSGKYRFEASPGFHDDMVMSLAIAWHAYRQHNRLGGYHIYSPEIETTGPYRREVKSTIGMYIHSITDKNDPRWFGDTEGGAEFVFFS